MTDSGETFFGLRLLTHRNKELGPDASGYFLYEGVIAAVSVMFFRLTIKSSEKEPYLLRLFFGFALGFLAYSKKPYVIICALQMFSYVVPIVFMAKLEPRKSMPEKVIRLLLIGLSGVLSLALSHLLLSDDLFDVLGAITPFFVKKLVYFMIPVEELWKANDVIANFVDRRVLERQLSHLLFVTFNVQVGLGYLGIGFLRNEQARRNQLVRLGNDEESEGAKEQTKEDKERQLKASRRFQRGALPFILSAVVPYMVQIIAFGNMNMFAFTCFKDDIHRAVRLNELFDHDSHLVAMANDSAMSPDAYASAMDNVVDTSYDLFNRKLFSLPKVMLLPGIILRQPMLVAQITPLIFGSDFLNFRILAFLTTRIEKLNKDATKVQAMRTKVEAFDMKNAELLQRSGKGANQFTQRRWEKLTVSIQQKNFMASFLLRTKRFFNFIQRHFVFSVMVDCALAQLIAIGKIVSAEIFVFSRAIEDAVDTVLMRSRAESELARLLTDVDKLQELANLWAKINARSLLPCDLSSESGGITLQNLHYSRGTASVKVDRINLDKGVYALTGANGSGKSTLFRVLMSCSTNESPTDLPSSIVMEDGGQTCSAEDETCLADGVAPSILMPSTDVAEISQNFYWPLYTRPIDWIFQEHLPNDETTVERTRRVAEWLEALEFMQTQSEEGANETDKSVVDGASHIIKHLEEEKEDWFGDLSGGQKSKVELVRKVFIHETCPRVLLIDETFAPLDPSSKSLVMAKLKNFCKESVVIVIYHTDVQGSDDGKALDCVASNNFFDRNIHLENRTLNIRPVC